MRQPKVVTVGAGLVGGSAVPDEPYLQGCLAGRRPDLVEAKSAGLRRHRQGKGAGQGLALDCSGSLFWRIIMVMTTMSLAPTVVSRVLCRSCASRLSFFIFRTPEDWQLRGLFCVDCQR